MQRSPTLNLICLHFSTFHLIWLCMHSKPLHADDGISLCIYSKGHQIQDNCSYLCSTM